MHPKEPKLIHRQGIGGLVLEGAMIVFSILLALGLENWNEHRKEAARCRTALALVRKEITRNRQEVDGILEKHGARIKGLVKAAEVYEGKRKGPAVVEVELEFPVHRSTVFDAAMAGRTLNPLNYETLLPVMEAYSGHAWLLKLEDTWLKYLLEFDPNGDREKMARQTGRLAGILQNYRLIEVGTIAQYDTAAAAIDRLLAKDE